jgi:hypothetical protein
VAQISGDRKHDPHGRRLRHGLLLLAIVGGLIGVMSLTAQTGIVRAASNPIVTENQQPGTDAWIIPDTGDTQADDVANQVKGYASASSVNVGGALTFYVTVNPSQTFTIDFYRLGYYAGLGGRLMQSVGPLTGVQQPACPVTDAATHLVACSWSAGYTLNVPATWTDGIYFAVLTNANHYQNYVPFVVRNDQRTAALLYQESVNTYQAYNNWGGYSLYSYNSQGGVPAYKVSFDRPYADDGSGDYFGWEVYMVPWLEQKGYDVTYSTDVDTDLNPGRLQSVKGFLSVGHDEYWTKGMFDAAQNARDAGTSLAFFGANDIYWQARFEPSAGGVADRVLVCYKTNTPPYATDPMTATNPSLTTANWRVPPVNRPEQALLGVQFTAQTGDTWDNTVAYKVSNNTNWVYAGSGFANGASIPKISGYEVDRQWAGFPQPAYQGQTYSMLASSPFVDYPGGGSDTQNASIYEATSGAWVFTSGTMGWNYALGRAGYTSAGIEKVTANILDKFVSNVPVPGPATQPPPPVKPPPPNPPSTYRNAILADNPIGYWRLGEASGATALDQQGSYPGTYENGVTRSQPGALVGDADKSVAFNGTTQYMDVPYAPALNPLTFSVEGWVYTTGGAGAYRGIMASRYYPQGWSLYAGASNDFEFWLNSGSSVVQLAGGTATLNTWAYVAATFNGTTATLYINGVQVASAPVPAGSYTPQSVLPLNIGQGETGTNLYFPGRVDEAAIYNGALSGAQVLNHYHAALGPPPTVTSISPTTGPAAGGTAVTVNGTGFSTTAGATAVKFGGNGSSQVSCVSTIKCTATSPAGSGVVDITVTVGGLTSTAVSADHFTYGAAASSAYRTAVLGDSPVSYWRLDEASGTTAVDQMSANGGVYEGSPTLSQPGALFGDTDTSTGFNGTSQDAAVPYSAALNTGAFSVEAWLYPTGGAGTYRGLMASRAYPQGWVLYVGGSNDLEIWINSGSGMVSIGGGSAPLNTWTHVVATFDGTNAVLYVNGVQVGSGSIAAGSYTPQNSRALEIGQGEPGSGLYFPGRVDEAAVYNHALSTTQVQTHYRIGTTGH